MFSSAYTMPKPNLFNFNKLALLGALECENKYQIAEFKVTTAELRYI
jgi:hypothetical protein